MGRIHITRRHKGNWIINLSVLLCNLNIIISESCNSNNETTGSVLQNWPCEWNSGEIPFVFNFYSIGLKRLMSIVKRGHTYLERRSCLKFVEHNPQIVAKQKNITFLYYNLSGVLESCCLRFYSKPYGRRMVLITPVCSLPAEVAHAILHGLGMKHKRHEPFSEQIAKATLFSNKCSGLKHRMALFDRIF